MKCFPLLEILILTYAILHKTFQSSIESKNNSKNGKALLSADGAFIKRLILDSVD